MKRARRTSILLRAQRGALLALAALALAGIAACDALSTRPAAMPSDTSVRYLALGDSYTIGEGVDSSMRWPAALAGRLRRDGRDVEPPRIVAVTGWTTDELSAGMDAADLAPGYDLVTLSIGVNNEYRGRSAGNYRAEFGPLLRRAIALAGGRADHVVVVSIPDWGVTRFAHESDRDPARIADELDTFNAIARDETTHAGARWVNITPLSRSFEGDASMFAGDGLHPSGRQYAAWTDRIEPIAREAVRSR